MDPDASPCDNFYQFACGGWEKKNYIPYHSTYSWSVIEQLSQNSLEFFKGLLMLLSNLKQNTNNTEQILAKIKTKFCENHNIIKIQGFKFLKDEECKMYVAAAGGFCRNTHHHDKQ